MKTALLFLRFLSCRTELPIRYHNNLIESAVHNVFGLLRQTLRRRLLASWAEAISGYLIIGASKQSDQTAYDYGDKAASHKSRAETGPADISL